MPRILLADDETLFGITTAQFLEAHGFSVLYREDGLRAMDDVSVEVVDLVIADLDMPGNRSLELLNFCRSRFPNIPFIVVTGRPTLPSAIEGIRLGIHDYFLKPLELDDLLHSVRRALQELVPMIEPTHDFPEMLGNSPAMQELKQLAERIARSQATVLIRGESGTGKELLARGIHAQSSRASRPFVTVDCTAIPETLLEATLFGHIKGAFTGADRDRAGLVAAADHGTLFLDEIGELPLYMQAKLLRLLQFGTFVPVGAAREQAVDIRILAATHRDLHHEVKCGTFRLDLFYRLSVLEITSPPLRSRTEDIPALCEYFLEKISLRDNLPLRRFATEGLDSLAHYTWPGNIRELQNTVERCSCIAAGAWITQADVLACLIHSGAPTSQQEIPTLAHTGNSLSSLQSHQALQERDYIDRLLRRHRGNIAQAAREANMSRQGLHKALGRLGIVAAEYR